MLFCTFICQRQSPHVPAVCHLEGGALLDSHPRDQPPQSASRGQGPPTLTAVFDLDLRGEAVFCELPGTKRGSETLTVGSDGGSRASPPAFCFIHAPPVAILSRCIEPSLTDPLCRRRHCRANGFGYGQLPPVKR